MSIIEDSIQELTVPLKPDKDERKWVRKSYNRGAISLLIHVVLMNLAVFLFAVAGTLIVMLRYGFSSPAANQFMNSLQEFGFTMILANIVASLVAYPVAIYIGCRLLEVKPRCFLSMEGISLRLVLSGIAVALGLQFAGSMLANIVIEVGKQMGVDFTTLDVAPKGGLGTNILMTLLACVSAPVFEELLFRGVILRAFSKVSVRFGIVMSALMFALFHQNIPQAINAFALGLLLAYVSYKAGSVVPAMLIHFAVNAFAVFQTALVEHLNDTGLAIFAIGWMILALGGGLTVFFLNLRRIRVPRSTPHQKKRSLPLFVTSWVVLVVAAVYGFVTFLSVEFL